MKNVFKLLSVVALFTVVFISCSKDDDPADNDLFVGTYNGSVGYSGDDKDISSSDGSVTVVKVGDNYRFDFSDGIPTISGVTMEKGENTQLTFEDGTLGYIRINEGNLVIAYTKEDQTWTANCDR